MCLPLSLSLSLYLYRSPFVAYVSVSLLCIASFSVFDVSVCCMLCFVLCLVVVFDIVRYWILSLCLCLFLFLSSIHFGCALVR